MPGKSTLRNDLESLFRGQILSQIPSLRQYAGCLTGSTAAGDELVTRMLQGLLAGEPALAAGPIRPALFKALHQVWTPSDGPVRSLATGSPRDSRLYDRLSPIDRATLLLSRLEGFRLSELAFVLGMSRREIGRRLDEAERTLRQALIRRVLIIEDNRLTAAELEEIVIRLGHEAIGPAATSREAVSLAMRRKPHLILSDVQLDDGTSGVDAVREIRGRMNMPVIFVTGFPEDVIDRAPMTDSYVMPKPFSERLMGSFITNVLLRQGMAA